MTRYLELLESEREAILSFDTQKITALSQEKLALLEALHHVSGQPRVALEQLATKLRWNIEDTHLPAALHALSERVRDPFARDLFAISGRLYAIDAHVRTQHTQNQDLTRRSLSWIHTCLTAIDGDAVGYNKFGTRRGSVLSTMQLKV